MILEIAIVAFIILELSNVVILYGKPEFKYGNGVGVFREWHVSKEEESRHLFAKYMARWVAGSKLIFIALLVVILLTGTEETKFYAALAMIASIASYYVALHPIIKKLDTMGQIVPKGYSKALLGMITGFILIFSIALAIFLMF